MTPPAPVAGAVQFRETWAIPGARTTPRGTLGGTNELTITVVEPTPSAYPAAVAVAVTTTASVEDTLGAVKVVVNVPSLPVTPAAGSNDPPALELSSTVTPAIAAWVLALATWTVTFVGYPDGMPVGVAVTPEERANNGIRLAFSTTLVA